MEELERQLSDSLYFHYRILEELTAMAFVDLFDFLEVYEEMDEQGTKHQQIRLKENVEPHSGVEIILRKDGFTIRAPYRMRALAFLAEYYDVLGEKTAENHWKVRIDAEIQKIRVAMAARQETAFSDGTPTYNQGSKLHDRNGTKAIIPKASTGCLSVITRSCNNA